MRVRRRLVVGVVGLALLALLAGVVVQNLRAALQPDPDTTPEVVEGRSPPADRPPPPDVSPPPPLRPEVAGESGLHYTPEELSIWRERAESGPYRTPGDARENSPGDWERIRDNAEEFLDDPSAGRWEGPSGDGCVEPGDDGPPTLETSQLRDAAFYSLVTEEAEYAEAVGDELLEQSAESGLEFSDSDRWCPQVLNDQSPALAMAHWLTKLLFAYDYLGDDAFADDEREQLDAWFADAARFLQTDIEDSLNENFVDRELGDYEISEARKDEPDCDGNTAFYDSKPICAIARYYNNRRAAQARLVGLVGVHQNDEELKETADRFARELIAFSVYPEGYMGEFERWLERLPDLGWAYAGNTVGAVVTIADHFARAGDTSLYEFTTSEGAHGTEGGSKSLRFAIHLLGQHVDGTYERYATDDEDDVGESDFRIDGSHEASQWYSLHDLTVTPSNVYYRDDYIHAMYSRSGDGMAGYVPRPAPVGAHTVWTGESGIYPGVLFMFGDMEGRVWPYPRDGAFS